MKRALVVIDVQESFRQRPMWSAVSNPGITAKVNRLTDLARRAGDLVIWVMHSVPGSNTVFDADLGYLRLIDGLDWHDDEPILVKTSVNAFTTTNLQQYLTTHGVHEIIVCGISTEQCCETTTRIASDYGYRVTFVTDATATFPIAHRDAPANRSVAEILDDPRTLGTAEIIARTEYTLAGRFATIATVAELEAAAAVMA